MKDPGPSWQDRRNHVLVMALAVCLAGCATAPKTPVAVDESAYFARPLTPEAEKRAEATARFATGLLYLGDDEREEAVQQFEKAILLDPTNDELAVLVANDYIRQHQYDKAIAMLERTVSYNPKSLGALYMLAHAYRMSNKTEQAIATYERITKAYPTEGSAYRGMVEILVLQNRKAEAMKLLNAAAKQKSDDANFWAVLGDLYAGTAYEEPAQAVEKSESSPDGKATVTAKPKHPPAPAKFNSLAGFARALDCYERAAKLDPDNETILKKLADLYVVNKLVEKAVPVYLKLLEDRPNRTDIRERLALTFLAQDDKKQAIAQMEEIVRKDPLKFKYQMMLGELYLDASRGEDENATKAGAATEKQRLLDKALAKFQEAIILSPNQIEPQLNVAYIYLLQKKPQQAVEALDKMKEQFPTNARVYYFYGLSYSDLKQYDQAVRAFSDTAKLADDTTEGLLDSTFYFYYGAALERAGDIEGAAERFLKSIEINANNAEAYNYLGYMWAEKGVRLNDALKYIQKALEHEPDNGAYLDSLGWVYFKLGKYDDALKELLRAATLLKEPDPTVFDHIAECYMQLGKKDEAIAQWKRAVEVDPANKEIAEKLKQAQNAK